jgi:hypothetical protein
MSEVELCDQEAGNVGGQRSYVTCFQGCKYGLSRRRITVTSSLKIFIDQLVVVVMVVRGRSVTPCSHSFLQQASGMIFIDDVNEFSSRSNICFTSGVFNEQAH